ncbi:hypothetical protein ACSBR2_026516 [Camellia fascicularis]
MQHNESISDMFIRFTNTINSLKILGKEYTNHDMVIKILTCLPKSWEAKVIAIQEAKDLSKLSMDELLGSLMAHELTMINGTTRNVKAIWGDDDESGSKEKKQ